MNIEKIIDEAYELYMPQDRYEITELAKLVQSRITSTPFNVLEIGTKFGGTFYIWNKLVQEHGEGMCISIDMSDGGLHGGISDEEMDKRDRWFNERFNNCSFIRGNSHHVKTVGSLRYLLGPQVFSGYYDPRGTVDEDYQILDFLFIDGDHTYEGVKQDFEMYSPFVKSGGIIALHDINDTQRHRNRNVYVSKFWNELVEFGLYETKEFNSNLDWAGIGLIIKP